MARVEFLPSVNEDLRRIIGHLEQHEAAHIQERLGEIVSASDVLTNNPLIGRLTHNDLRELVIGQGARGYIALYQYVTALDTVFVLAIRAQREAGYARDD
ncbi:plasmid stabilization protein [Xanthomonas nasturtii]|uniref:Type II toxin-antitoxin system RelE/ParE family toxin n=1 Tax=Xanthomonas nasturtii TaxID=1843581 RepID=A0A3E1KEA5_9XANT|nr:type II toxin-antitoxin system RelE/ParE family toxin [Xanthomonas nasturtii]MCL1532457.1 type II toxin-antitoxin system RelE/ParE family toxin [Xanthomonas nasturtii]MCL1567212.1 type II toxin-antitoxin system RelE/ParE family toxin [Xanthomonas nasturtii]MCL1571162.1 type II toxin-antitoxin system RelE/ParE family toxin [Xanthomonas nasturtii]MCL1574957.1 type II toxin-antitoxin system RelE/ParE family toxin [Xanthomonas nasturtii]MCL1582706.1 type II toxin-antitoxin system RelE/ParE fami